MLQKKNKLSTGKGFTLLELIVVLAGLGILSSLAIPNFIRILDFNNIDEAKALLNTSAADCLQKSRLNDLDEKDTINDEILSDKRLNTIGYRIDPDANKCSYLQLVPTNKDDNIRYPIGFSVSDGKLSKFAEPTSSDGASVSSCENWAGINCRQDESLKELIAWKLKIREAESTCDTNYRDWLKNGTKPYVFKDWNSNATSGCPSRPPKDGSTAYKTSNTCTPNGCNGTVYGLDGEFVGRTKEQYDLKLEEKYGRVCSEWVAQKAADKYTNNPIDQPVTKSPECGDKEFWFFEGVDAGSSVELIKTRCSVTHERWRTQGENKRYEAIGGPGDCGKEIWVCNKSLVSEEAFYSTEGCGFFNYCSFWLDSVNEKCLALENSNWALRTCKRRPNPGSNKLAKYDKTKCGVVGMGRPDWNQGGWTINDKCAQWAACVGYKGGFEID
jgi:prepilin-type N-terminal cleavage/methylation domain-containing protein